MQWYAELEILGAGRDVHKLAASLAAPDVVSHGLYNPEVEAGADGELEQMAGMKAVELAILRAEACLAEKNWLEALLVLMPMVLNESFLIKAGRLLQTSLLTLAARAALGLGDVDSAETYLAAVKYKKRPPKIVVELMAKVVWARLEATDADAVVAPEPSALKLVRELRVEASAPRRDPTVWLRMARLAASPYLAWWGLARGAATEAAGVLVHGSRHLPEGSMAVTGLHALAAEAEALLEAIPTDAPEAPCKVSDKWGPLNEIPEPWRRWSRDRQ